MKKNGKHDIFFASTILPALHLLKLLLGIVAAFYLLLSTVHGSNVYAAEEIDEQIQLFKVQAYKYYNGIGKPQNYAKALNLYKVAAQRGDAEAQFVVGGMFFKGMGTDPDLKEAFKWLLKAAKQNKRTPESMQIIGSMYLRGSGVPQSYKEAKKWLIPAAQANNLAAITDLAFIYYHGLDGQSDLSRALELYTQAALQGDSLAQSNVGMMHATGTGTARDLALGYAWYSIAASQGNTTARISRNSLMADMSWEELNRAQAISVSLYQQIERFNLQTQPRVPTAKNKTND
ncbi:tetratricopeptide repeat protein [Desulfogranum marinum]|uniref:tetratricopeptide repeat protein n=1 Tax=Desulfogranum marinum TaxID=453220 RepID=UPI0029C85B7C|nr:tetratricopeptide repeat protein [Desulfogranum marinum]